MDKTEIIIDPEGRVIRRDIAESVINVGNSIIESLCADTAIKSPLLTQFKKPGSDTLFGCHGSFAMRDQFYTVFLDSLPMQAPFRVDGEVLVPSFNTSHTVMPMTWTPNLPAIGMRLIFVCQTSGRAFNNAWLFAVDPENSLHRLPMANLYDDCRLCLGQFQGQAACSYGAVSNALNQFWNSKWNSDLLKSPDEAAAMFRFKSEGTGFVTLSPTQSDWRKLCLKVGPAIANRIVL